jgi:uncharacterized radical SAM superfamily Fe-S cluster-containing enzyme
MIETLSLCPACFKKIPAFVFPKNGEAWMVKECDVHGKFEAMCERSWLHWSNFYRYGTMGMNNCIIVHIENKCNMRCKWCYYGCEKLHTQQTLDQLLYEPYKGFSLMFSGGEPTERPDYHEFTKQAYLRGWNPSTITNMINLANEDFFNKTLTETWTDGKNYRFAMSFQHPKNYSSRIFKKKRQALENIEKAGLKASCVMFSIQSLDEIDFIKDFYDRTKHLYQMLRIRTMFHNWQNKSDKVLFQSDLHQAFMEKFSDYTPIQCSDIEQSTAYGMYLQTRECKHISLMSAPTVNNLDYHLASRPVFMLGQDMRCYPVPIAQIVSEGIGLGWKDGFQIKGV